MKYNAHHSISLFCSISIDAPVLFAVSVYTYMAMNFDREPPQKWSVHMHPHTKASLFKIDGHMVVDQNLRCQKGDGCHCTVIFEGFLGVYRGFDP